MTTFVKTNTGECIDIDDIEVIGSHSSSPGGLIDIDIAQLIDGRRVTLAEGTDIELAASGCNYFIHNRPIARTAAERAKANLVNAIERLADLAATTGDEWGWGGNGTEDDAEFVALFAAVDATRAEIKRRIEELLQAGRGEPVAGLDDGNARSDRTS